MITAARVSGKASKGFGAVLEAIACKADSPDR